MTPKTAEAAPLEAAISRDLRVAALTKIRADALSAADLASRLGVFPSAAEALLVRTAWPLDVAVRVVSALGIRVRVDATSEAG